MTNPMPPSQCSICRQKSSAFGSASRPPARVSPPSRGMLFSMTEAPVVLSPEAVSKSASETRMPTPMMKGRAPSSIAMTHESNMMRNPSRSADCPVEAFCRGRFRQNATSPAMPSARQIPMLQVKPWRSAGLSPMRKPTSMETTMHNPITRTSAETERSIFREFIA